MFRWISLAALLTLMVFGPQRAPGASPDLSTPKKAAVAFARQLEAGDLAATKDTSIGSEDDFKLVGVISGLIRSALSLKSAAVEKFGEGGKQVVPNGDDLTAFSKRVEEGVEKIDGQTATVGQPREQSPMKLKRAADGSWRVDLSAIPDREEILKAMPKVQKVFSIGATEIKSGKYKSVDEARNAIADQMFAAISEPATSPAAGGTPK